VDRYGLRVRITFLWGQDIRQAVEEDSELDRIEVFRRTYGSSERGFGFGCQRSWIDEPARAQVGEDEPPNAGCAGRLAGLGRGRMPHGVSLLRSAVWTVRVVDEEIRSLRVLDDLLSRTGI
jgi:hypothetical protein